jgi:hypothetical protein
MRKEGWLLTVVAIVIVVAFAWPINARQHDPYRCVIVHQRKDGSCPPGYVSEKEIFEGHDLNGVYSPHFTEADGSKEYACMDLRAPDIIDERTHVHLGVGLAKEQCTDFLRPGEKGDDSWIHSVTWN